MTKRKSFSGVVLLFYVSVTLAVNPNSVKTTLYNVDGTNSNVITTTYSDGLGRTIEEKLQLPPDTSTTPVTLKDRVNCTFYDDEGRPRYLTKAFIDFQCAGTYLPGELNDVLVSDQLKFSNKNDLRAFSESEYWDDPLSRIKAVKGPGTAFQYDVNRSWIFGVGKEDITFNIVVNSSTLTVHFTNGFIVSIITPEILDALTEYFYNNNVFSNPRYFLTINKDFNDKYYQEISDLFYRTLESLATSDDSTIIQARNDYDILGNLLVQAAPKNGSAKLIDSIQCWYNTIGQLISKSTPDGGLIQYTYYDDGSLQFETTLNSSSSIVRELRLTYDIFSRPILLKEYGPNISCQNNEREITTWIYDDIELAINSSIFKNVPRNYLSSVKNLRNRLSAVIYTNYGEKKTSVGEIFSYDDEGNLCFKITAIEGIAGFQESRYEYDIHGKITAEYCFYNGEILKKRYEYDQQGRLADIYHCITKDEGSTYTDTLITHNTYDDLGVLETKSFSTISGYNVGYTYDIRDRLTNITKPSGWGGFEEIVGLYDKAGNIRNAQYKYFTNSSSTPSSSFDMAYTYDDIYRLKTTIPSDIGQTAAYGASFNYDQAGRFISKQEGASNLTGYEYYTLNNRLKKTSKNNAGEEYVYDEHGNLVIDFTKKMIIEYDWRNLPVVYRFYNMIPSGITKNSAGTYTNGNLYSFIKSKVDDNTIKLLSTVVMIYDAAGDRVGKLDFN